MRATLSVEVEYRLVVFPRVVKKIRERVGCRSGVWLDHMADRPVAPIVSIH